MFRRRSHDCLRTAAAAAVCLVAHFAVCAAQTPIVQVANAPDSARALYLVPIGTNLNLTCNASSFAASGGGYTWRYSINDLYCNLTSSSTISSELHIVNNVSVICYKCSYTPPASTLVYSASVVFYPYTPPSPVASGQSDFSVATEANVTCSYQGSLAAANMSFLWTRASTGTAALQTTTTTAAGVANSHSYLLANTTSAGDTYYCHLIATDTSIVGPTTNGVAGILLTTHTVYTPPYAEMYSYDKKQYTEGDTVKVACKVFGYPITNFTWQREGAYYNPNTTTAVAITGGTNISFTLTSLDHVSQRGDYRCIATGMKNGSIATYVSAVKTLHARSKLAPLWPAIGIIAQFALVALVIGVSENVRSKEALAADGKAGGAHNDGSKKG